MARGYRLFVLLLAMSAACTGGAEGDPAPPSPGATASPTDSPEPGGGAPTPRARFDKPDVSPVPAGGAALDPDGRYLGFIRSIDTGADPVTLELDVAELLTGAEGLRAAIADGAVPPDAEALDNDFYLRNRSPQVRTVALAGDVRITLVECREGCENVPAGLSDLTGVFEAPQPGRYTSPESLFDLTLRDGEVVLLDENYLP